MGSDPGAAFAAVSRAILSIAAERSLAPVLAGLAEAARELVEARYAAIGVPADDGETFARFVHVGMSPEQVAAIGPLPRRHGLLGALLRRGEALRTDDITRHPEFEWWPSSHPRMRSFLGIPIVARGEVLGAVYLTDREGGGAFTAEDQRLVEVLAAHAAVAIDLARLLERSREASLAEERARLARELHDSANQRLFSLQLLARTAADAVHDDPDAAASTLRSVAELARTTLEELRAMVAGLQPPSLAADGLAVAVAKHAALMERAHGTTVRLVVDGAGSPGEAAEREVFLVVQEALGNALRHGRARSVTVTLALAGDPARVEVADDGVGFDPGDPRHEGHHLGLVSMRERAADLGGTLTVNSAPGRGTMVVVEFPARAVHPEHPGA